MPEFNPEKRSPRETERNRYLICIQDWANEVGALATMFSDDLEGLKKYIMENPLPSIYEKYKIDNTDLARFPEYEKRVVQIDSLMQRLLVTSDTREFKQLVNALFLVMYPDQGSNRIFEGEEVSADRVMPKSE